MHRLLSIIALIVLHITASAQFQFKAQVTDSAAARPLPFATVTCITLQRSAVADSTGHVTMKDLPAGTLRFRISRVGYEDRVIEVTMPQQEPWLHIQLEASEKGEEVVIIASSRTNSRIEDLPTKVEVLGAEELQEENGIKPGNIASLLGDIAGIQVQQTSASTGNADMRVQGLPGKYTQVLRDGMPLFGGYSGSFSILQIPPLDLYQIELVKGASSTLFGGGAIAGMINLVSKSPVLGKPDHAVTVNYSTLNEANVHLFLSERNKRMGYTFFAGTTQQKQMDVNKDGYSDVPKIGSMFIHPRLFFYPNEKDKIVVGYTANYEDRKGGDMQVITQGRSATHQFFIQNRSWRNTVDADWQHAFNGTAKLQVKGSASFLDRAIGTNVFGMRADQLSYYTEAAFIDRAEHDNWVAGININGERFTKRLPDSSSIPNNTQRTVGLFIQNDHRFGPMLTVQAGLRFDHHDQYGGFLLPRLSVLYKLNAHVSTRIGGGLGYKTPTLFNSEVDERDYQRLLPLSGVKAEKSYGINWDVNFKQHIGEWNLTVNQMFYLTRINDPLLLLESSMPGGSLGKMYLVNADAPLQTSGFETYVAAVEDELELYLGYTYTVAKQRYDKMQPNVPLSARNKFASVVSYEFSPRFRAGIESAYTGRQYLDDGSRTPGYLFMAAMVRCNVGKAAIVLNCENLLDYRQTRKESILLGDPLNPRFKQLWAPIDGRVVNLSVTFKW